MMLFRLFRHAILIHDVRHYAAYATPFAFDAAKILRSALRHTLIAVIYFVMLLVITLR